MKQLVSTGLTSGVGTLPTPTNSCPIDPVFRANSLVLAISAEKDGNLRVVYAQIGRCQGHPAWPM